jgi:hypothetical protein
LNTFIGSAVTRTTPAAIRTFCGLPANLMRPGLAACPALALADGLDSGVDSASHAIDAMNNNDLRRQPHAFRWIATRTPVPAIDAAGSADLRLRHRRVFEPPRDRAGDGRLGGVSLCGGNPPSRSRHDQYLPPAVLGRDRIGVPAGAATDRGRD